MFYKMCCVCFLMERKSGSVGMIILIVVAVLIIIAGGVAVYFYNFHVFKTVRICVGEGVDTGMSCSVTQDCIDLAEENGFSVDLSDAPVFVQENFQRAIDEIVYCETTCFAKNVRGIDFETQELQMLENCENGEVEIAVDIHGKEGLAIMKWLKARD